MNDIEALIVHHASLGDSVKDIMFRLKVEQSQVEQTLRKARYSQIGLSKPYTPACELSDDGVSEAIAEPEKIVQPPKYQGKVGYPTGESINGVPVIKYPKAYAQGYHSAQVKRSRE